MDLTVEFIFGFSIGLEVIYVEEDDQEEMGATHVFALSLGLIRFLGFVDRR